jgi:hypothetical protein
VCGRVRSPTARALLDRLRDFRGNLGANQYRMHRFGSWAIKLRSLYTWRDPVRTRLFLLLLLCAALALAVIPFRLLFAAAVLHQFTKPLRSRENGVLTLARLRFWDGLPIPSAADPVYAHPAYFLAAGSGSGGGGSGVVAGEFATTGSGAVLGAQSIGHAWQDPSGALAGAGDGLGWWGRGGSSAAASITAASGGSAAAVSSVSEAPQPFPPRGEEAQVGTS